jgi:hypothetical protein
MALIHPLFRLCQLPTPDTAISAHRRRDRALPLLAPSILVAFKREQRVFTTVRTTPIFVRTQNTTTPGDVTTACAVAAHPELTQNAMIIPLLKQRREEERRERRRGGGRSDETICEDVRTTDITTPTDSATSIHTTRDFSSLSSGARNPWGSIQRRNRRYRPRDSPRILRRTYHSLQYPADNYKYESSPSQPTTPRGVIETIHHPHGIGPAKLVIRIPVTAPVVAAGHPEPPVHSNTTKSAHLAVDFKCHCGRLIQVSKVSTVPHLPIITHPTLTSLISDFMSYPFPSRIFSFFRSFILGIATRASL